MASSVVAHTDDTPDAEHHQREVHLKKGSGRRMWSAQADDVANRGPVDEADHVPRHRRHDPPVLIGIAMAVVNIGDTAGPVIGDPVHRIAAKAEPGDPRQAGAPQSGYRARNGQPMLMPFVRASYTQIWAREILSGRDATAAALHVGAAGGGRR